MGLVTKLIEANPKLKATLKRILKTVIPVVQLIVDGNNTT